MRLVLFVEGETEQRCLPKFLKRWLDPKLATPIAIQAVRFNGWATLDKDAPKKAALHLAQPEVAGVFGLLDLYGPEFYPPDKRTAKERFEWAKQYLENKVNRARFQQFFAVHELEAWLLSDPSIFPEHIRQEVAKLADNPENVNFDKPPKKRLKTIYVEAFRRSYKVVAYGADLFGRLDPALAYAKCPRLKQLLDAMLQTAQSRSNPERR